jgi:hypothetical protein
VPDDDIREGIRRIGKALREQVGLYGTLTGTAVAQTDRPADADEAGTAEPGADEQSPLADVVALPRRPREDSPRRRQDR